MRESKSIGESIERQICEVIGFEHIEGDDYYDAFVPVQIDISKIDAPFPVRAHEVLHLPEGARIEIKACARRTSNGDGSTFGRWFFKGLDEGQHAKLTENGDFYALIVYDDVQIHSVIIAPASAVGEWISDCWYSVSRRENTVAKLSWNRTAPE